MDLIRRLQRKTLNQAIVLRMQNDKLLFSLLILSLSTQFGKHVWPSWAYVNGQQIDYLSPTLYVTDLLVGLIFIWMLFQKKLKISPFFLIFVCVFSLSIFFSQSPLPGWYWLLKFLELSFFSWYISTQHLPSSKVLSFLFAGGILFQTTLALFQYIFQHSLGGLFYFFGERTFSASTPGIANVSLGGQLVLRPYGTLPHPNVLAGFLLVSLFLFLAFSGKQKKLIVYVVVLLAAMGIILSLSRGAFLALALCSVVFLFRKFFKKQLKHRHIMLLGILFFILGTGVAVLSPLFFQRFLTLPFDESITLREQLFSAAWALFTTHSFLGVGPNNFLSSLVQFHILRIQPVHNIFVLFLVETGLLGGIIISIFFIKLFIKLKEIHPTLSLEKRDSLFWVLLSFLAICITGLFDHYWLTLQQGQLLFFLVIGFLLRSSHKNNP